MAASIDDSVLDATELQRQLEEKDQLVLALTERLEEAAEQLDRAQRSGTDKGGRGGGSGPSTDAQQKALVEQLSKSVELWEDVQPGDAFARIEARLDDLRGLLANASGLPVTEIPATTSPSQSTESQSRRTETSSGQAQSKEGLSAWEQMKAELMGDGSVETSSQSNEPPAAPAVVTTRTTSEKPPTPKKQALAGPSDETPLERLSELELPESIDLETAERRELETGIESRDQYISYLTRRLRSAESRTHQPIDWESLNNAPEDLRETLQQLEADLVDRLRIAEVDLSLERARLSRVETRVRGMQRQIERQLKSAGRAATKKEESPEASKNGKRSKSWFGSRGR